MFTVEYKRVMSPWPSIQLDIILAYDGQMNTYWKGESGSVMDLSFVNPFLIANMSWNVNGNCTRIDHQAIAFEERITQEIGKYTYNNEGNG